jgi:hypothetical protein
MRNETQDQPKRGFYLLNFYSFTVFFVVLAAPLVVVVAAAAVVVAAVVAAAAAAAAVAQRRARFSSTGPLTPRPSYLSPSLFAWPFIGLRWLAQPSRTPAPSKPVNPTLAARVPSLAHLSDKFLRTAATSRINLRFIKVNAFCEGIRTDK